MTLRRAVLWLFFLLWGAGMVLPRPRRAAAQCASPGWRPASFGLKDHTVFTYQNRYYLASIYVGLDDRFAYGVSDDLCTWTTLDSALVQRPALPWNEMLIWAPDVVHENGVYYMFYTSVDETFTQRIALATSTDPADPASWQVDANFVFTPSHAGTLWNENAWADFRDPHVFQVGSLYYLLYTGRDTNGGIVGLATADALTGPWQDFGSILTLESGMPESPTMLQANGGFYLVYNRAGDGASSGEKYRFGPAPGGPWGEEQDFSWGWAHEIWRGLDGQTYVSYLTTYTVSIAPLIWNRRYAPPRPFVGRQLVEMFLPLTRR